MRSSPSLCDDRFPSGLSLGLTRGVACVSVSFPQGFVLRRGVRRRRLAYLSIGSGCSVAPARGWRPQCCQEHGEQIFARVPASGPWGVYLETGLLEPAAIPCLISGGAFTPCSVAAAPFCVLTSYAPGARRLPPAPTPAFWALAGGPTGISRTPSGLGLLGARSF